MTEIARNHARSVRTEGVLLRSLARCACSIVSPMMTPHGGRLNQAGENLFGCMADTFRETSGNTVRNVLLNKSHHLYETATATAVDTLCDCQKQFLQNSNGLFNTTQRVYCCAESNNAWFNRMVLSLNRCQTPNRFPLTTRGRVRLTTRGSLILLRCYVRMSS